MTGRRLYSRDEAATKSGLSVEYAQRLWRAVGFPDVGDEAVAFTDADLTAIGRLRGLIDDGLLDDELAVSVTRALGHNAARLAEWLFDALVEHLVEQGMSVEEATRVSVERSTAHIEELEVLLVLV